MNTMNRKSLKILILLIAISFILQIALLGYAFAQGTSAETEQNSEEHNLYGNYDWGYGGDYYNATMYYPNDFKQDYYDSDDSGGYAGDWGDYEYDYYDWGYGGDQVSSDYYDWGVNDYDLTWADFGGPWDDSYWVDDQSVDTDAYAYDWGDYDSFYPVEDGIAGGATYDSAPDAFSLPIDDKSQFIIGIGIDDTKGIESIGAWQQSFQVAQDLIPETNTGLRGMGESESASEFLRNLGLQYE